MRAQTNFPSARSKTSFAISLIGFSLICGGSAQADEERQTARLKDTTLLMTALNFVAPKYADCQPLGGERVAILAEVKKVDGMPVTAAKVQVLEGRCKNKIGYVGMENLRQSAE